MTRTWCYRCSQCRKTGTCPVPIGISILNASHLVSDAHAILNPECHKVYQGRWLELVGIR